jgi:hypothetical protein
MRRGQPPEERRARRSPFVPGSGERCWRGAGAEGELESAGARERERRRAIPRKRRAGGFVPFARTAPAGGRDDTTQPSPRRASGLGRATDCASSLPGPLSRRRRRRRRRSRCCSVATAPTTDEPSRCPEATRRSQARSRKRETKSRSDREASARHAHPPGGGARRGEAREARSPRDEGGVSAPPPAGAPPPRVGAGLPVDGTRRDATSPPVGCRGGAAWSARRSRGSGQTPRTRAGGTGGWRPCRGRGAPRLFGAGGTPCAPRVPDPGGEMERSGKPALPRHFPARVRAPQHPAARPVHRPLGRTAPGRRAAHGAAASSTARGTSTSSWRAGVRSRATFVLLQVVPGSSRPGARPNGSMRVRKAEITH